MSDNLSEQSVDLGALESGEFWWRDHQPWLLSKGYALRPRYDPEWSPSWKKTGQPSFRAEDSHAAMYRRLLDATRVSDKQLVQLKLIVKGLEEEVDIIRYFSSEALTSDPRNHCISLLEVLEMENDPDYSMVIVMPFLRRVDSPRFDTVGEVVECLRQIFETVQLMHEHHYAHRDIAIKNIMLDATPLYPDGFHPHVHINDRKIDGKGKARRTTRTLAPVNYYLIDFGLSWKHEPLKGPPIAPLIHGNDRTVPEFQGKENGEPYNPFPTDIYYLGNFIREEFLATRLPFNFIRPLVDEMTNEAPEQRPTIDTVVAKYAALVRSMYWWTLRARVRKQNEIPPVTFARGFMHIFKTMRYTVTLKAAIPAPPRPKRSQSIPVPTGSESGAVAPSSSRIRLLPLRRSKLPTSEVPRSSEVPTSSA